MPCLEQRGPAVELVRFNFGLACGSVKQHTGGQQEQ